MLALTNSYWYFFFINESDMAQTAWRGSRSQQWNEIMQKFGEDESNLFFQASVLFSLDTMGWEAEILDFFMQLGNIV